MPIRLYHAKSRIASGCIVLMCAYVLQEIIAVRAHVEDAEQGDDKHDRGKEHQAIKSHAIYKATADSLSQSLTQTEHDRIEAHDSAPFAGYSFSDSTHL